MLWLYILCAVAAVIAILLFLPLKVFICFDGKIFTSKISYLFIPIINFSTDKNKKKKVKRLKKTTKSNKTEKKTNSFSSLVKTHGFAGAVGEICNIVKMVAQRFIKLLGHVKAKGFKLDISVTGKDAADAAINYGKVCAAVYPLLGFLSSAVKLRSPKVNLLCAYDADRSNIHLKTHLSVAPVFILSAAIGLLFQFVKIKVLQNLSENKINLQKNKIKKGV